MINRITPVTSVLLGPESQPQGLGCTGLSDAARRSADSRLRSSPESTVVAPRTSTVRTPVRETHSSPLLPLLTIEQVAAYLSVNGKTVRRWVTTRRIPCIRIGTRIRFDHGDIVSWVRQRKEG